MKRFYYLAVLMIVLLSLGFSYPIVLFYSFNEPKSDMKDYNWISTGTLKGISPEVAFSDGKKGNALDFYEWRGLFEFSIPKALIDLKKGISVAFFVMPRFNDEKHITVFSSPFLKMESSSVKGKWQVYLYYADGDRDRIVFDAPNPFEWASIVITAQRGLAKLYINGNMAGSVPVWSEELNCPEDAVAYIGGDESGNAFNGKVDEFKIFNRVLWEDEILRLANS